MHIEYRLAEMTDAAAIETLIAESARGLRGSFYSGAQVEGAIGDVFGVDSQLIKDGTYFVALAGQRLVGCGGWSKRNAPYGGDHARSGEDSLRDPDCDPAMIRAFFVHPEFARKGVGRELMRRSEIAARESGFRDIEIVATLPGEPLYAACGFTVVQRYEISLSNGEVLPVVRMRRGRPSNTTPEPVPPPRASKNNAK